MTLCPHCGTKVLTFNIEKITGHAGTNTWNCISYNCSHCHVSLSVQIDPVALKTEIVEAIKSKSK